MSSLEKVAASLLRTKPHAQQSGSSATTVQSFWATPPKRKPYNIQYETQALERAGNVKKILGDGKFRSQLESILQGQLNEPQKRHLTRAQDDAETSFTLRPIVPMPPGIGTSPSHLDSGNCIIHINDLRGALSSKYTVAEHQLRCKVASMCRLVNLYQWNELLSGCISACCDKKEQLFLVNPYGLLYEEVTASSLVKADLEGNVAEPGSNKQLGINSESFEVLSAIFATCPDIKCATHLASSKAIAVSSMRFGLLPLSQEACYLGRISCHDHLRIEDCQKIRKELGTTKKVLILRNHGMIVVGKTVEEVFHDTFNLMKACDIQISALVAGLENLTETHPSSASSGQRTAAHNARAARVAIMEFEALMRMLDNRGYSTGYRYKGAHLLEPSADKGYEERRKQRAKKRLKRRETLQDAADKTLTDYSSTAKTVPKKEVWDFLTPVENQQLVLTPSHRQRHTRARVHHPNRAEDSRHHKPRKFEERQTSPQLQVDYDHPPSLLMPIDKAVFAAEQVAQSTGEAVEKLTLKGTGTALSKYSDGLFDWEHSSNPPGADNRSNISGSDRRSMESSRTQSTLYTEPDFPVGGVSLAEKAAHAAREVAASTGSALQQVSSSLARSHTYGDM